MSVLQARQELVDLLEMELRSYAAGISLVALGRTHGTLELTKLVCNWAHAHHLRCEQEVDLGLARFSRRTGHSYRGLLDFVIGQWLAIEIDSSNKHWSLTKLLHAGQLGYVPVWVRWFTPHRLYVPTAVHLIVLPDRTGSIFTQRAFQFSTAPPGNGR